MKNLKTKLSTKRLIAFSLSFLLIMQQSFMYQVLASTITNADGSAVYGNNGVYNVRPDAVNNKTGFKQFDQINLSQDEVLNFVYNYITQTYGYQWNEANGTNSIVNIKNTNIPIDTFVALVNKGVNIQGIVNALQDVNGSLKSNGNLNRLNKYFI